MIWVPFSQNLNYPFGSKEKENKILGKFPAKNSSLS